MQPLPILLASLLAVCLWEGCAKGNPDRARAASSTGRKAASNSSTNMVIGPMNSVSGKVVSINKGARFAVLNFPIGKVPPAGQRLNVYRNGVKIAEIKVSGPQEESNTVGDIVGGDVQVHDDVRED